MVTGLQPKRSTIAPTIGWVTPHRMFCTAIAKVNSATVMPTSRVIWPMNRPRLWRMPIDRLSMTEAPTRIDSAAVVNSDGRRDAATVMRNPPAAQDARRWGMGQPVAAEGLRCAQRAAAADA